MNAQKLFSHDAIINLISINRMEAGVNDTISFKVTSIEEKEYSIRFIDCYHANLELNFGIVAPETVRQFEEFETSSLLDKVRMTWQRTGVDLSDLTHFKIETNSTNSVIDIIAKEYEILPVE